FLCSISPAGSRPARPFHDAGVAQPELLTARPYECAKLMKLLTDPDNVASGSAARGPGGPGGTSPADPILPKRLKSQKSFCCENDIDIVRVNDVAKLGAIVGPSEDSGEPRDLHCILITNPNEEGWKDPALEKLNLFCEESRNVNDWVPTITLPE
uniref:Growth arrest and DNA damage inducible gamma n=1 Tax=Malurus cyaneus samueli TaxID=2593467 RepID=A0A8C5UCD2_9PASS